MAQAKFILRFDDICPTFHWDTWNRVVDVLDEYGIKPIIAVIPNNEDSFLNRQEAEPDFWEHIRAYQRRGWMIAMHGFNHRYTNHKSGIMGISANSEFAGLPYELQLEKIGAGVEIFKRERVKVDAFIAPSHSFDKTTLRALRAFDIRVISDGHLKKPYTDQEMLWLPCQLWEHFNVSRAGVYTVCYHPNVWTEADFLKFREEVSKHRDAMISPREIGAAPRITLLQKIESKFVAQKFKLKRLVKKIIRYKNKR